MKIVLIAWSSYECSRLVILILFYEILKNEIYNCNIIINKLLLSSEIGLFFCNIKICFEI